LLSRPGQTVVFYMALKKLSYICTCLISAGRATNCPAVLIENGSTSRQRVIQGTLGTLPKLTAEAGAGSPALLIIGEVAAMAKATTNTAIERSATDLWSDTARV